ncbi:MAG TPA: hypothetical protein ENK32_11910 [Anaerolineae bacterium]|nr:hypothetical protein [Anaerolineae bacterium]
MKHHNTLITASILIILVVGGIYLISAIQSPPAAAQGSDSVPQSVQSPTNTLFSYQGELLDMAGNPINNPSMPMTFKLYSAAAGGSACWTENQTVNVQDGRFHTNLGAVAPIPDTCLGSDAYLELAINGETLTPRELLTSVAYAVEANTLPHQATTRGMLKIAPGPDGEGGEISLLEGNSGNAWNIDNRLGTFRLYHDGQVYFSVKSNGDVNIHGHKIEGLGGIISNQTNTAFSNGTGSFRWIAADSVHVFIDSNNDQTGQAFTINADNTYFGGGIQNLFRVDETKETTVYGFLDIRGMGNAAMEIGQVTSGGNMYLDLTEGSAIAFRDRTVSPSQEMFKVSRNGDTVIYGNLDLRGSCVASAASEDNGIASAADPTCTGGSLTTGAVIEANLQTPDEQKADSIARFELGDVLCVSPESGQLELCATPNNRLVQAVANRNGKPVVMGAEPIKVIGPTQIGDILVTSDVPGYAMVNNNPAPGAVIGQALENFNGESGLIKAMIRKW